MGSKVAEGAALAVGITAVLAGGLWMQLGWHPVAAWLVAVNGVTPFLFWLDKRRATSGGWRTPESVLLLLSFLGGWPGGLLSSQLLRHKTRKGSFRGRFWGVVVLQLALVAAFYYWAAHLRPSSMEAEDRVNSIFSENPPTYR